MKVSSLTLYLTDDCNFDCSYCYQIKGNEYMPEQILEEALVFFFPFLTDRFDLNFYGGEPLLAFNLIKKAIAVIEELNHKSQKEGKYSLTTNGSLSSHDILNFLNFHLFLVELSFDGLLQDRQRKKGSARKTENTLKKLLDCPHIQVEVNSVFLPDTVNMLYDSIRYILSLGVPTINLSLSTLKPWNEDSIENYKRELTKLREFLTELHKIEGNCPVANFRGIKRGSFFCAAGKDRFAVAPNGDVWGCFLFPDYFKAKESSLEYDKFFFGHLTDFAHYHEKIYPHISRNYSELSLSKFSSGKKNCLFCSYFEYCRICPINAAFSGSNIGNIPEYICKLKRVEIDETQRFSQMCVESS
ncbi:MAG: 4Fe-4S cluster-binding domain-containing protein [Candidatus Aminicenantes bacterium]|jgi:radical SAM protein with 4Fe4S-binding SPASM domain